MKPIRPIRETMKAVMVGYSVAVMLVAFGLLATYGCTALETERGRLRTAADSYAAAKQSVADAWEAGKLDRAQKKQAMRWVRRGDAALEEWRTRLEEGGPTKNAREKLMRAASILNTVWMEAQHQGEDAEKSGADSGGGSG